MSTTEQRLAANRANALHSTGPVSIKGKAAASRNAVRHGLLSTRLFLEDEDPADFDALFLDLQKSLAPVGTLELALAERIAIGMWRQRRLVQAETAATALCRSPAQIARGVSGERDSKLGSHVAEDDLQPYEPSHEEWCRSVIAEIEALDIIAIETVATNAPLVWGQLSSDADEDHEAVEDHVKSHTGGITGYVMELLAWCRKAVNEATQRPRLLALAEQLREKRLLLPTDQLEALARYQTTLDNQLYKALRAFRDAQEWRLKTLEGADGDDIGIEAHGAAA